MTVRAVVTHPRHRVELSERDISNPGPDELVVRVHAFSLNRGEVNFAPGKPAGTPIGWDFAGVVEEAAARGGPEAGTRVVGFSPGQSGWAERTVVAAQNVAPLPEDVAFEVAAALPVAAGTALACIDAGPQLIGRRALVTGVTGGVGGFLVALARAAGAHVVAPVRKAEQVDFAIRRGADEVVVTCDGAELSDVAPVDFVADGIGGSLLASAIARLTPDGVAVNYGVTGDPSLALPLGLMLGKGRASVRGLNLYAVSDRVPPREWLTRLVRLTASGRLPVDVVDRGSWSGVIEACDELMERRTPGKLVLHVD
jgi:NADPH2:quinone reductase